MSEITKKNLKNEIEVLLKIDHKNVIKLEEVIEGKRFIALVQEYCNGGDLQNFSDFNGRITNPYLI